MGKVQFDEDGYPVRGMDEVSPQREEFTEEDYAFLEEFRELMEEFK